MLSLLKKTVGLNFTFLIWKIKIRMGPPSSGPSKYIINTQVFVLLSQEIEWSLFCNCLPCIFTFCLFGSLANKNVIAAHATYINENFSGIFCLLVWTIWCQLWVFIKWNEAYNQMTNTKKSWNLTRPYTLCPSLIT